MHDTQDCSKVELVDNSTGEIVATYYYEDINSSPAVYKDAIFYNNHSVGTNLNLILRCYDMEGEHLEDIEEYLYISFEDSWDESLLVLLYSLITVGLYVIRNNTITVYYLDYASSELVPTAVSDIAALKAIDSTFGEQSIKLIPELSTLTYRFYTDYIGEFKYLDN